MENLDTDIPPSAAAVEATRPAIGQDDANSWLPFTGRDDLKEVVAAYIERRGGPRYDAGTEIVITSGEGDAMLDALFCLTDRGDEVVLTDPTYVGMLNRVRLVGATPRLVPLHDTAGESRLDFDILKKAVTSRTRVVFINQPVLPDRLGRERRGAGGHRLDVLRSGRVASVLGWLRGRPLRRPPHPPSGCSSRHAPPHCHRGGASLEQRIIAWRVGWVVAPGELVEDIARVHIYTGLVPSGFAQVGTTVALGLADDHLLAAKREYQRRRDETLRQLDGLPVVRPAGR
jgi:aspartate/methionine/tyrosine aminotransferase